MARDVVKVRLREMKVAAKVAGKYVPSDEELLRMIPKDMQCPHCKQEMVWRRADGKRANVASLQHDENGRVWIICLRCNCKHSNVGDAFYQIPIGHWRCKACGMRPEHAFYRTKTGSSSYCVECTSKNSRDYYQRKKQRRSAESGSAAADAVTS